VADLRLGLLLSTEADIKWLINERKERLKKLSKEYAERIAPKLQQDDDQLP